MKGQHKGTIARKESKHAWKRKTAFTKLIIGGLSVLIAGTHANCELALSAADERRDGGGQSVGGRKRKKERENSVEVWRWAAKSNWKRKTEKRKLED